MEDGARTARRYWPRLSLAGYFDETARLEILAEHDAFGPDHGRAMEALTGFAADLCVARICLVSLVGADRQSFIARFGLDAAETPREMSFCQHAMVQDEIMVIPDARADPRFADNALVTGEPFIRFYAGVPLRSSEGAPLGALCVIHDQPRDGLTPLQARGLSALADQVMAALYAGRRDKQTTRNDLEIERALRERESRFRVLADTMPQMVWSTRPDGFHDYYNARWYAFTGAKPGTTDGEAWNDMFHPDDQERAWAAWRHSLATGEPYEIEYRLRDASGEYRWTLGRALPMLDGDGQIMRWFGTCTDIHEQKLLLEQRQVISQELSHRIKNIFSIIAGMISLSARRHPQAKAVADDLRERVIALGQAHDFVRPHSPASAPLEQRGSLRGMLTRIFAPYDGDDGPRVIITGFDPKIDDRSATPLALLFHELATNAAKYGALSEQGGVARLEIGQAGDEVTLDWRETGGPRIAGAPEHVGFGTQLIEISALRQLGARLHRDWDPGGLHLLVTAPAASLSRPD